MKDIFFCFADPNKMSGKKAAKIDLVMIFRRIRSDTINYYIVIMCQQFLRVLMCESSEGNKLIFRDIKSSKKVNSQISATPRNTGIFGILTVYIHFADKSKI